MFKSKANWTGVVMVVAGALKMLAPEWADAIGLTMPAEGLIGSGLGLVFLRLGIAKNGTGV